MKKILLALVAMLAFAGVAQAQAACVVGAKGAPPTATLSFPPVTLNSDGTPVSAPVSYNVYMSTTSGGETLLKSGITSPSVINSGLSANKTYYFYVVAIDAAQNAGAISNEVCKSFPVSVPGAVVVTIS